MKKHEKIEPYIASLKDVADDKIHKTVNEAMRSMIWLSTARDLCKEIAEIEIRPPLAHEFRSPITAFRLYLEKRGK